MIDIIISINVDQIRHFQKVKQCIHSAHALATIQMYLNIIFSKSESLWLGLDQGMDR